MNQSQVNNFLVCLSKIDDTSYMGLHREIARDDDDHDHDDHDHDHDQSDNDNYDLLIAKVTAMVVLFCASTACGSIPFLLNRCFKWTESNTNARSATVVKCLLYFGGGVLLCTTFLHLLPEVQETVEQLQECGTLPELSFPLAELLMCLGFFAMFLIEELIHAYIHRQNSIANEEAPAAAAFERGISIRDSYLVKVNRSHADGDQLGNASGTELPAKATAPSETQVPSARSSVVTNGGVTAGLSVQNLLLNDMENQKYQANNTAGKMMSVDSQLNHTKYHDHDDLQKECTDHHHHQHHEHHYNHHNHHHSHNHNHHHHHHQHSHNHSHTNGDATGHGHSHLPTGEDTIASSLRGLLIVLALSLHELFEGMAIGLESSTSNVWFMFGAVSAHKLVLAFCVGVELIVARTRFTLSIVYVLTFAIVSPIGIGVGILISHSNDTTAASIPSAVLQGLATGTLLYVVFFEILSKNRSGLIAYLAFFVGFAVMFGLQQTGGHEHSHSCGGGSELAAHGHSHDSKSLHAGHSHHHHDPSQHDDDAQVRSFQEQLKILREASRDITNMLANRNKTKTN